MWEMKEYGDVNSWTKKVVFVENVKRFFGLFSFNSKERKAGQLNNLVLRLMFNLLQYPKL